MSEEGGRDSISAGIDPEFGEHDGDDMVPVVEEEPLQERGKLLEEGGPGAVAEPEGAVAVVEELEGRVQEEGQDVQRGQEIGEVTGAMSEVVFEAVAPELQRLDVLVFDLPSGPTGLGERDERVFRERMIGDPGVVIEDLARLAVDDGKFEPVRKKGVVRVAKGKIGHEAEGPVFPDDLGDPFALGLSLALPEEDAVGSDLSGTGEVIDPLGGRGVGRRLAGEKEMESGRPRLLAEELVGIEIVSQEGDSPRGVVAPPGVEPPRGRPDLAVLLFPTVLPDDELRRKRDHPRLSGSHQGQGDRDVTMQDAPVRTVGDMAGGTVDSALGRKGVGPVQGHQKGSVQDPIIFETVLFVKPVSHHPDEGRDLLGGTVSRMFRIWTSVGT